MYYSRISHLKCNGKSDAKRAETQEKQNALHHRIRQWQTLQDIYMPMVAQLRTSSAMAADDGEDEGTTRITKDTNLSLPSALPIHLRSSEALHELISKEKRLRIAQADDALADIRRLRRVLTDVRQFRKLNVSGMGQKANTRMRALYDRFMSKIQRAAAGYRAARAALTVLDPEGDWSTRLLVLQDKHISGPGRDDNQPGEGRYEQSWIWRVARPDGSTLSETECDTTEFNDSMRVEWARAKARAERWGEEEQLLEEEMRRTIEYMKWRVKWWRQQAHRRIAVSPTIISGLQSYAERQAVICEQITIRFASLWLPCLRNFDKLPGWANVVATAQFPDAEDNDDSEDEVATDSDVPGND